MEGTYCRALAGTTMHLIINSLDTRRWMSDGGFARGWWVAGQGVQGGGGGGGRFVARATRGRKEGGMDRRRRRGGEENGGLEESGWGG